MVTKINITDEKNAASTIPHLAGIASKTVQIEPLASSQLGFANAEKSKGSVELLASDAWSKWEDSALAEDFANSVIAAFNDLVEETKTLDINKDIE
mgnify:CR=1 FL=1